MTDQYLAENPDLIKAFLIAEIKGWTDVFKEATDDTVDLVVKHYNELGERPATSPSATSTRKTAAGSRPRSS